MRRVCVSILLATLCCVCAFAETIPIPAGATIGVISLGAESIAFSYMLGAEGFVQVGDTTFGPFASAPAPQWSADGQTSYFVASEGDARNLYVDGTLVVSINAPWIRYSVAPTGGGYFAHGSHNGQYVLFHNGESRVMLEDARHINSPGMGVGWETWAPDGSSISYTWSLAGSTLYSGFDAIAEHSNIYVFARSEAGPIAYAATDGSGAHIYWGEEALGPFDRVNALALSPDAGALAYSTGRDRAAQELVVDGDAIGSFADIRNLTWAPDGSAVSFVHGPSGDRRVWAAGEAHGPFPDVLGSQAIWNPDAELVAFATLEGPGSNQLYVHAGEDRFGPYPAVRPHELKMAWSPDGRHFLHSIVQGGMSTHYIDGREIGGTPGQTIWVRWGDTSIVPEVSGYGQSGRSSFVYVLGAMRVGSVQGNRVAYLDGDIIRVVAATP